MLERFQRNKLQHSRNTATDINIKIYKLRKNQFEEKKNCGKKTALMVRRTKCADPTGYGTHTEF